MSQQIRLLLAVPRADDASSFYRAFGPMGGLRRMMGNLEFTLPSSYSWATMGVCDILFMQRPADPQCLSVIEQAKTSGTPVWVDFDDDNLAVPKDNPTVEIFGQFQIRDAIIKCARAADIVTVSTEFLKKKYTPFNKNIVVVPNAIDDSYMRIRNLIPKRPRDRVIAWRNGPGFLKNTEEIVPSIIKVANANPRWKFIFMGYEPYDVTGHIKNYQHIPWLPILDYFKALCQIHAATFIHCLKVNDHSLSRSHNPWMEAAFCGAGILAKKVPELERPGSMNFETAQEFEEKLTQIMRGEINIEENVKMAWDEINEKYLLSKVNLIRKEVIERLLSSRN